MGQFNREHLNSIESDIRAIAIGSMYNKKMWYNLTYLHVDEKYMVLLQYFLGTILYLLYVNCYNVDFNTVAIYNNMIST